MKRELPPVLDEVRDEFERAVDVIRDMPAGDLRARKVEQLHKAKAFILHADMLARKDQPFNEVIYIIRDALSQIVDLNDKQLKLPFIK